MNRVTTKPAMLERPFFLAALVMLAAAICTVLPGIAGQDRKASATERAAQLVHAGEIEQAVQLLQSTIAAHPENTGARLALANLYAESHHMDKAEQLLNDTIHGHPDLTAGHAELALVLAMEHKYAEAKTQIRMVPPPAETNARIRYFRLVASISSGMGDSHAAAHAMEEALRVLPANEDLQLLTSVTEAEAGEWQACIRNVAPLYAKHPASTSGLLLLRAQLASQADFLPTLQSLRTLDLPENQMLELRARSGELLAAAEKDGEAAEEFRQALRIAGGQDETLLYNLAVEQYRIQQFDEALGTLTSLRAQKDSAELEGLSGDIEEQKGDLPAAVHSYENAVALAPGEEQYRLSLGAELLQHGNYAAAASVFQEAAKAFPKSARMFVGLGMSDYFTEKYDDSVSAFLTADKLDPGSGRAIGYLGATQVDNPAGPIPAAVASVCRRAESHPTESATVTWCGALLFRKAYLANDLSAAPDAILHLRRAARLAPDDPVANCSLGHALEWTEQLAEARHSLEICVRLRPGSAEDHYRLSHVYQRLGFREAAAEQADLTNQANAEPDPHQAMAKEVANEMLGASKSRTNNR